jgi:hypothetical protein
MKVGAMLTKEQIRRIAIKICEAKNLDPDEMIFLPSENSASVRSPRFIEESRKVKEFALMLELISNENETNQTP